MSVHAPSPGAFPFDVPHLMPGVLQPAPQWQSSYPLPPPYAHTPFAAPSCCSFNYTPCFCPYPSFAYPYPQATHPPFYHPHYPAPSYPPAAYGFLPLPPAFEENDDSEEEESGGEEEAPARHEEEEAIEAMEGDGVEEAELEEDGEERTPFYVLSEEAIALFARSEERRRKERNRRRKEQAKEREEAKKARYSRKTGTFVTLSTLGEAGGGLALERERLERARLFGEKGLNRVEELEGTMATLYNSACDLKQPVVWPSMPLRLGS